MRAVDIMYSTLPSYLKRAVRIVHFDTLRICLQSLVASAVAYACLSFVGSASLTWGVFASLFTLQAHFDRSLKQGIGQIVGVVIGTVAGLAALHVLPTGTEALPRLAIATVLTCLSTALFPSTNYSIVVAAAIALEASGGTAGALSRASAIVLGAVIAIIVSMSVWPQLARSRAFRAMAELLDDCRALLGALLAAAIESDRHTLNALHERFLRHLVDARAIAGETRFRARFHAGPTLHAALSAFETLWHGLVLFDRVGEARCALLPGKDRDALMTHVKTVCACSNVYLEQLAQYMRDGARYPHSDAALKPLRDASAEARAQLYDAMDRGHGDRDQLQALANLSFALEQIEVNLINIGKVLENEV
jgi:hypothetical protein